MISDLKEKFNQEYDKQKAKTNTNDPKTARKGAIFLIILGFLGVLVDYIVLQFVDRILLVMIAIPLAFFGLGIWTLITGKFPKIKS